MNVNKFPYLLSWLLRMMSYIRTDSQGTLKTLGKYRFTSSLAMQGRSPKNITEEPRHPCFGTGT